MSRKRNISLDTLIYDFYATPPERSAFGEKKVVEPSLETFWKFQSNINAAWIDSTTTGSGTITHADNMAVLSTTANASSTAAINTKKVLRYQNGVGAVVEFTAIFTTPVAGSAQTIGLGNADDGLFFSYGTDTTFNVCLRHQGVDTIIAQADWSVDKMDGSGPSGMILDHMKGNVYKIQYQWLGFGAIRYFIENPETGEFQLVHVIKYANTNTTPSLHNPTLPLYAFVENTTNDSNIVLKTASAAGFVEGKVTDLGPQFSTDNTKNIGTTETNILTIRNMTTFVGETNRVNILTELLGFGVDGIKNAVIRAYLNTTLGGTPSYSDVETDQSVIEVDTAGTTVSGGQRILAFPISKTGSELVSLPRFELKPGDTLTFTAQVPNNTTDATITLFWKELL